MLIAQIGTLCDDRAVNIAISSVQQFAFGAAICFISSEAFATSQAITIGVMGGKTWAFIFVSYGLPILNVGITFFFFGSNYGTDPRCFIGWENDVKMVFFYFILPVLGVRVNTLICTYTCKTLLQDTVFYLVALIAHESGSPVQHHRPEDP